jgi:hypothetical protein
MKDSMTELIETTRNVLKEDVTNYLAFKDDIASLIPADKHGYDIKLRSSKGETLWLRLDFELVAVLEDFFKANINDDPGYITH